MDELLDVGTDHRRIGERAGAALFARAAGTGRDAEDAEAQLEAEARGRSEGMAEVIRRDLIAVLRGNIRALRADAASGIPR